MLPSFKLALKPNQPAYFKHTVPKHANDSILVTHATPGAGQIALYASSHFAHPDPKNSEWNSVSPKPALEACKYSTPFILNGEGEVVYSDAGEISSGIECKKSTSLIIETDEWENEIETLYVAAVNLTGKEIALEISIKGMRLSNLTIAGRLPGSGADSTRNKATV